MDQSFVMVMGSFQEHKKLNDQVFKYCENPEQQ